MAEQLLWGIILCGPCINYTKLERLDRITLRNTNVMKRKYLKFQRSHMTQESYLITRMSLLRTTSLDIPDLIKAVRSESYKSYEHV